MDGGGSATIGLDEPAETIGHDEPAATRRPPRFGVSFADVAFVVLVIATVAFYILQSRGYGFRSDDWHLASRGWTLGDYLQPYNNALNIVPIAAYHLLFETFGFGSYVPFRFMTIAAAASIGIAIYLVVRSRVGPVVALVAAAPMLWFPGFGVVAANMNHYVALTACIACAWLLTKRGLAADIALMLTLALALAGSGAGVAGAAGCLVYLALDRASWRRWAAVVAPTAAWIIWWRWAPLADSIRPSWRAGSREVFDGVMASFRGLVGGVEILGALVAIAFVALLVLRLRHGLRAARNQLAWTTALVAWWVGLIFSRQGPIADQFRYQMVGSAFVILAFLPLVPTRLRLPPLPAPIARHAPTVDTRAVRVAIVAAAIVVVGVTIAANRGDITERDRLIAFDTRLVRERMIAVNAGSKFVADDQLINIGGGSGALPAGHIRDLFAKFGTPPGTNPSRPDPRLLQVAHIRPRPTDATPPTECVPIATAGSPLPPTAHATLHASDASEAVSVELRRFGREWVTVGPIPAGADATLDLPGLGATTPWMIRAPGACVYVDVTIQQPDPLATVKGATTIVASSLTSADVRGVEFFISGTNVTDVRNGIARIGTARATFVGWILHWDTTSRANGSYILTSVVTDANGNRVTSPGMQIIVRN